MLRWSSVKLMSIGRVCTCGHTAGALGPDPLDGGHHLVDAVGAAAEWNSGDSVVGMP